MRLNRYLAACGLGSRRAMDALIASGRVRVNGRPLEGLGQPVDPVRDLVTLDGKALTLPDENLIFAFNKPLGVLTTMRDPEGRATVADYLGELPLRVFPVGRLDMDSAGLLLCTNDGKLAHRIAHPRYGVEKEYRVLVDGDLTSERRHMLEHGIELEEGITSPARVLPAPPRSGAIDGRGLPPRFGAVEGGGLGVFHIVLHEGWKRQVRRMCAAAGIPVLELTRVRCGPILLGDLAPGCLRRLNARECASLRAEVGLSPSP